MFGLWKSHGPWRAAAQPSGRQSSRNFIESLEARCLLSAASRAAHALTAHAKHHAKASSAILSKAKDLLPKCSPAAGPSLR